MEGTTTVFTTAPEAYDYGSVRESEVIGETVTGQTLRRVEIMEGHWVKYQVGRYRSGLHLATEDEQHALSLLRPVEA